jgi:ketosteroid isomerase-like protein
MSQENVETTRRSFEAFNRRDVDQLISLCDPDCEWLPFRAQLEGISYRGHDGVRRFLNDMDDDWSEFRIDPLDLHQRDERVVAIGRVRALGRGGTDIDFVAGFVIQLRDGRITQVTSHSDPEEALEAVGLRE